MKQRQGKSGKSVNGRQKHNTINSQRARDRTRERERERERGEGDLGGVGGCTHWRWEASLIPLCISFTSLAVSTNRIGSKAQGLGGE